MTDAPDGTPKPANRWQQSGMRGATALRKASVQGWQRMARSWGWLVAALQDEAPARPTGRPSPPGPPVEQRDAPRLIAVPSHGYVYCFYIRATFAWSSPAGMRAEVLSWYARYFLPQAMQRLTRLAADAARDLPPHRAADLEVALQRALTDDGTWRYERGDILITCRPDTAVRLDPRMRPTIQPHVDRLVELDCRLQEHLRQARHAERLSRRWATILGEHLDATDQPDQDLADARRDMLKAQKDAARWIDELLVRSPHPHPTDPLATPSIPPQQSRPRPAPPP